MVSDHRAETAGIVTIVITLLGWSSVPLFLEHFTRLIDAWTSNGWRYGFSALLWAPVLVWGASGGRLPPGLFRAAIVPSALNAAGQIAFVWAHYKIEPGVLTFGLRSQLIFAAAGAYLLFPVERPIIRTRGYLLGLVLLLGGTSGAILLGREPLHGAHLFGLVLAVMSGLLFAGYGLSVRWFMRGVHSVHAFAAISQYTAAVMVALMLVLGRQRGLDVVALPRPEVALLLLSAFIGIALGHVFYYMSIARLGVAVSAGVLQLQPFIVAVASFVLFREALSAVQWIAGGVALSGATMMLAVQRGLSRAALRAETAAALAESESGG